MEQLQIIGYIGKDAEVKNFGGTDYAVFSLAVSKKDKNGTDTTTWYNCFKYGTNEKLLPYLKKGIKIFAQGALTVKESEKDGKHYVNINVNVEKLQLLSQADAKQETRQESTQAEGDDLPF